VHCDRVQGSRATTIEAAEETSERSRGVDVIWLEQVTLEKEKILEKAKARQAPSPTRVDGGVFIWQHSL
jgi:hypothetical protein